MSTGPASGSHLRAMTVTQDQKSSPLADAVPCGAALARATEKILCAAWAVPMQGACGHRSTALSSEVSGARRRQTQGHTMSQHVYKPRPWASEDDDRLHPRGLKSGASPRAFPILALPQEPVKEPGEYKPQPVREPGAPPPPVEEPKPTPAPAPSPPPVEDEDQDDDERAPAHPRAAPSPSLLLIKELAMPMMQTHTHIPQPEPPLPPSLPPPMPPNPPDRPPPWPGDPEPPWPPVPTPIPPPTPITDPSWPPVQPPDAPPLRQ